MQHLPSIYIVWKTISNSLFSLHQKHHKDNQFSGIASIFLCFFVLKQCRDVIRPCLFRLLPFCLAKLTHFAVESEIVTNIQSSFRNCRPRPHLIINISLNSTPVFCIFLRFFVEMRIFYALFAIFRQKHHKFRAIRKSIFICLFHVLKW